MEPPREAKYVFVHRGRDIRILNENSLTDLACYPSYIGLSAIDEYDADRRAKRPGRGS